MMQNIRDNVYVFTGFKDYHKLREVTDLVMKNGHKRPWSEFKKEVLKTHQAYDIRYLKAEYNHAVGGARMASKWLEYPDDTYLQYSTVGDSRTRPEHRAWNGIIRKKSDNFWDTHYPPNGWNCRCNVVQEMMTEQQTLLPKNLPDVDAPMFRNNIAKNGVVFPDKHPFFEEAKAKRLGKGVFKQLKDFITGSKRKALVPKGTPISEAFSSVSQNIRQEYKDALEVVSKTHGDGVLDKIPIKGLAMDEDGKFRYKRPEDEGGRPVEIRISTFSDYKHLAIWHEIGHFLDYQAFGQKRNSFDSLSDDKGELHLVFSKLEESKAVKTLRKALKEGKLNEFTLMDDEPKHIQYLLKPYEMWARAYAQYIATVSGSKEYLEQALKLTNALEYHAHWEEEDFEEIYTAIEQLLIQKGWMIKK